MAKYLVDVNEKGEIVGQPEAYSQASQPTNEPKEVSYVSYAINGGILLLLLVTFFSSILIVKQQSVVIIERLGKFLRVAKAGLTLRIPFIDQIAGKLDLRVLELTVPVETKTLDNVFVQTNVSVQYFINPEKVSEAFYKLGDADKQISSYIFDVVRSEVPKLKLDEVFAKKEDIAVAVKANLANTMDDFGYTILQALITDINPDQRVKEAMNEINAQQRHRLAATEKAEAEKILLVKQAEGEAESKALQGKGIADQRAAIINGLEKSIDSFQKSIKGANAEDVMRLVMMTQYFDTLKDIGSGGKVVYLPHSPAGMTDIENQIRLAISTGNESK